MDLLFSMAITKSTVLARQYPVARSRSFFGGVGAGLLRTLGVGVGIFYSTPEVQLNHF